MKKTLSEILIKIYTSSLKNNAFDNLAILFRPQYVKGKTSLITKNRISWKRSNISYKISSHIKLESSSLCEYKDVTIKQFKFIKFILKMTQTLKPFIWVNFYQTTAIKTHIVLQASYRLLSQSIISRGQYHTSIMSLSFNSLSIRAIMTQFYRLASLLMLN